MLLAQAVHFYDPSTGTWHRYISKPLSMKDGMVINSYKNKLAERNKGGELDDVEMMGMANYPLIERGCAAYQIAGGYSGPAEGQDFEAWRDEVMASIDWGEPITITEEVFLGMAESFLFGVLGAIYEVNPERRWEFELLKKIMESVQDLTLPDLQNLSGATPSSETNSDDSS